MKTKLIAYLAMLPLLSFVHVLSAEEVEEVVVTGSFIKGCLLYTSPSPQD